MLIVEKLPLFALSAASCVVTVLAQRGATVPVDYLPFHGRVGNALMAYAIYLRQTIWPSGLAVYYPHSDGRLPPSGVLLSALLLAGVCAAVFFVRRKYPYLVTGWLWFLGMLVPVIGVMQVGFQAHADRYTYLPQIGLFIVLAWGIADASAGWQRRRLICGATAILALAALGGCTWLQASYWRDSVTLWTRTLGFTSRNFVAHNNLGIALASQGKTAQAIENFRRALEVDPYYAPTSMELGNALVSQGHFAEAVEHYEAALRTNPHSPAAHKNLGAALGMLGRIEEAIEHYRHALKIKPDFAQAHVELGDLLAMQGKIAEAVGHFRRALDAAPDSATVHSKLGAALQAQAKFADAIGHYTKALEIAPGDVSTLNNLGWILATCREASLRNGPKAIELARKAETLAPAGNPAILDTLSAAYAEAGRFSEAVETARRALDIAVKGGDATTAREISERLQLYELGLPYREKAQNR